MYIGGLRKYGTSAVEMVLPPDGGRRDFRESGMGAEFWAEVARWRVVCGIAAVYDRTT